jgi:hypothetical protein
MPPTAKPQHGRTGPFVGLTVIVAGWIGLVFGIIRTGDAAQEQRAIALIERMGGRAHTTGAGLYHEEGQAAGGRSGFLVADFHTSRFSRFGDDDLFPLRRMPQLAGLDLTETRVTDAGLAEVGRLPHLTTLKLSRTPITDAGLAHLTGLASLRQLDLDGTRVSDAGVVYLLRLPQLRRLNLDGTRVGDAGLLQLRDCSALRSVSIARTCVRRSARAMFAMARPDVELLTDLGDDR